jgi:hypothetical protein
VIETAKLIANRALIRIQMKVISWKPKPYKKRIVEGLIVPIIFCIDIILVLCTDILLKLRDCKILESYWAVILTI